MADKSQVGELYVKLGADNTEFNAAMSAAEAQSKATADKLSEHADLTAKGFRKSVAQVTGFIGSLTAAVGVATTFFEIGKKIRETWDDALKTATDRAKEFAIALDTADPKRLLEGTEEQIRKIEARIAQLREEDSNFNNTVPETDKLEKEKRELNEQAKAYRQQIQAREDSEKARAESLRSAKEQADSDARQLEDLEKYNKAVDDLAKGLNALKEASAGGIFDGATASDLATAAEMRAFEQAQAIKIAKERAEIEKQTLDILKRQTDEYLKQVAAFQDLQQRQVGGFGLGNMEALLSNISRQIDRLPGFIQ